MKPTSIAASPAASTSGEVDDQLLAASLRAILTAAERLGADPLTFAERCSDGQIADLILDLRLARHGLGPVDRKRVEELLQAVGGLP